MWKKVWNSEQNANYGTKNIVDIFVTPHTSLLKFRNVLPRESWPKKLAKKRHFLSPLVVQRSRKWRQMNLHFTKALGPHSPPPSDNYWIEHGYNNRPGAALTSRIFRENLLHLVAATNRPIPSLIHPPPCSGVSRGQIKGGTCPGPFNGA